MHIRSNWSFCYNADSATVGLEWSLKFCISNKFPDDTDAGVCGKILQGMNDSIWSGQEKSERFKA